MDLLSQEYPAHVPTAWLGHSAQVAMRHYWRVTEADFEKAIGGKSGVEGGQQAGQVNVWQGLDCGTKCGTVLAQNAAQQASATESTVEKILTQTLVDFQVTQSFSKPVELVQTCPVGGVRFERTTSTV